MTTWQELLNSDPQVCGGETSGSGTRVPVIVILDNLAGGASREEILASYLSLRLEHIQAALAYAAELAYEEVSCPSELRKVQVR